MDTVPPPVVELSAQSSSASDAEPLGGVRSQHVETSVRPVLRGHRDYMGGFNVAVAAALQRASPLVAQALRRRIFATVGHLRARRPSYPSLECAGCTSPPRRVEDDDRVRS